MISFYPGPSKVYDSIPGYVRDAYKAGILSVNHRSEEFMVMNRKTISLLRQRLKIPRDYVILYTGSATECWEIIAQSLNDRGSYHFHNGAFGQKWFEYTKKLHHEAISSPFGLNDPLDVSLIPKDYEGVICITQNETSNGTQVSGRHLKKLRDNNPHALIAVDATSSMAGIRLDFTSADIWFASVQKCFGMPAGLGLMICSPRAIGRASTINEKKHYNSLLFMTEMALKWQTSFTPNVMAIYLLMRIMQDAPSMSDIHKKVVGRYEEWIDFLEERESISHLVDETNVHSYTVIPVKAPEGDIKKIKAEAKKNGILLGEGYGPFKPYTFRIANFPALSDKEIKTLKSFLKKY